MQVRADSRERLVKALFAGVAILACYTALVAFTGGFEMTLAGVRLRSHSWSRPGGAAAALAVVLLVLGRSHVARASLTTWRALEGSAIPRWLTGAAVAWALAAGVLFGTFAAGGGDSYGYVSQALLFSQGRLTDTVPLDPSYQWFIAHHTLTPLGFTPGRGPGVIAPTYPPGFPLLMAPAALVSRSALYLVVPAIGALAAFLCYRLGRACGDPLAGGITACLLAVSPTFVFHLVQPMSDVPAAACWLAAMLLAFRGSPAASGFSGAAVSVAILIRPNLAPLGIAPLWLAVVQSPGGTPRLHSALWYLASMAPAAIAFGWIQTVRYGSPFASGYGDIRLLYAWEHVLPNLRRYPRWLTETHTWFIWLSAFAPFTILRPGWRARPLGWAALAFSAGVLAMYLPYFYFQAHEWTYSRFLLPAIPLMLLLSTLVALSLARRLPTVGRAPAVVALVMTLIVGCTLTAYRRHAFDLRRGEQRYVATGDYVNSRLPPNAIVFAGQHSGSVRLYGKRPIVRWDLIEAGALDSVLATIRTSGRMPFMVVDDFEFEEFRARFGAANQAAVGQARIIRLVENVRVYAFD